MITKRIFDWAQRTPNKTALIYNDQYWSYRSFADRIELARSYFLRQGYCGPGYVMIAVHNLLEFWILSLALRSLGLTTLAVDAPKLTWLELPGIRWVITCQGEDWPDLANFCRPRGLIPLSVRLEDEHSPEPARRSADYEPGGHILFTSGTTGRYKMLLNTPDIDTAFLSGIVDVSGLTQDSVLNVGNFPAWTGPGYKWAAAPWMVGGTTLINQERVADRALMNPLVTHTVISPFALDRILASPADAFARNETRQLIVAGGAMTRRQIEQAKARITPRIFNHLASTEAGGIAHTLLETPEDQRWHRPLPHRVVEVVSESDEAVPTGEIGRLRVKIEHGPTGYLDDEAATKDHFKDGYFYPGDLAVMRADGRFALQGRYTDVINQQGGKIFPGPIEDSLREVFDVSGVCLFSMQNESGEEELYVVIESSTTLDAGRVAPTLNRALGAFPTIHVRYVSSLPRNAMGKVLRHAVRAQVTGGP